RPVHSRAGDRSPWKDDPTARLDADDACRREPAVLTDARLSGCARCDRRSTRRRPPFRGSRRRRPPPRHRQRTVREEVLRWTGARTHLPARAQLRTRSRRGGDDHRCRGRDHETRRHRIRNPLLRDPARTATGAQDRKCTRLNSSHVKISYAVFCLKKKIISAFLAYLLIRLSGADREVIENWLSVIVVLGFLGGFLRTAQSCCWLCVPYYSLTPAGG